MYRKVCLYSGYVALFSLSTFHWMGALAQGDQSSGITLHSTSENTTTPIKHVIIVIGENRSFDNLFATYRSPDPTQHVWNLLSQGIITMSGDPGVNFGAAAQHEASDTADDGFLLAPRQTGSFDTLPQPNTTLNARLFAPAHVPVGWERIFENPDKVIPSDPGLAAGDQSLLQTGGILLGNPPLLTFVRDARFPKNMPNGPFSITKYLKYTDTTGDPMHRFYQNWQQIDCSASRMTPSNPSGCAFDLFPWVATTVGWGPIFHDSAPPKPFTDQTTWMGGVSMGFYNMAAGDVPYFASLADKYALSDNYHQFQLGGTGPNSITIGTAAPLVHNDANGNPTPPRESQVEDPDAYAPPETSLKNGLHNTNSSNNWYRKDGFALPNAGPTSSASYTNCSDRSQPGVKSIMDLLDSLPYEAFNSGNCAPGAYYLVNNQYPAYMPDGTLRTDTTYSVGPSSIPTMGDRLSEKGVSWTYYGEGYDEASPVHAHYCEICNPFQYSKKLMTSNSRSEHLQDLSSFFGALQQGTLPAVSYIKPDGIVDGHPGTSTPILFEAFARNIVNSVQSQSAIWKDTAIFITTDESGGLYDSGYVQLIDFFGDGPRIMLLAVSPYARPHYVDHTYGDHASLSKFIEQNWGLQPISPTSRDNLPNPTTTGSNPYVPTNSPALGDLMTMFDFSARTASDQTSSGLR